MDSHSPTDARPILANPFPLRIARKAAQLTQAELAHQAGVDHSCISRLEGGSRDLETLPYPTVVRLARALHLTPEEVFPMPEDAA